MQTRHHGFPSLDWLDESLGILNNGLSGPITKARVELSGRKNEELHALWDQLRTILDQGITHHYPTTPAYVLDIDVRLGSENEILVDHYSNSPRTDYVAVLKKLISKRDPNLFEFTKTLDSDPLLAVAKLVSLSVLREAGEGNPEGALQASSMLDRLYPSFRMLSSSRLNYEKKRQKAAKKASRKNTQNADDRYQQWLSASQELIANKTPEHNVAAKLAKRYKVSPVTIRRGLIKAKSKK